jgi:hypothetical protein
MPAPSAIMDGNGNPIPVLQYGASQAVAFGPASLQSTALAADTRVVRLCATNACYVKVGANPTATANDPLLPANMPEYIQVLGGEKVAVLQVAAAGSLNIVEMK